MDEILKSQIWDPKSYLISQTQIVFIFGTLKLATQYPVYTRGTKTHTKNAHTRGYRTRDNSNVQNFITLKNVFDEVQTFTPLKMFQTNPNALTREFVRL